MSEDDISDDVSDDDVSDDVSDGDDNDYRLLLTPALQEVITNEHVVAMMKAAINETEAVPPFVSLSSNQTSRTSFNMLRNLQNSDVFFILQEPKMTRSKFKEVVEKGVVRPVCLSVCL